MREGSGSQESIFVGGNTKMTGKLLVMEGLDGSGKATQTALLCEELANRGLAWKRLSFPDYDQPSATLVKMYLAGEFGNRPQDVNAYAASSFYAVDRYASYQKFWREDYQQGIYMVADRYVTSNIVYQMSKLPFDQWGNYIDWVEDFEYEKLGLPRPSRVIYLDMPPLVSQKLLSGRYHGNEEKKDIHESNLEFLNNCRKCAAYAAKKLDWTVISCALENEPKAVSKIHEEIVAAVMEDFNR